MFTKTGIPHIISLDSDSDGLPDKIEYQLEINNSICKGLKLRITKDSDADTYQDAAEYAVAQKSGGQYLPAQMVCNKNVGIKHVYKFYFELPYDEKNPAKKDDTLTFVPKVGKLDVVFNMDTTGSMGASVANLKENIRDDIIPKTKERVSDSGFGVTRFDDFPTNGYGWHYYWGTFYRDLPFVLYGTISTDAQTVTNNVNKYSLHAGNDGPESGYEALWQIVKGDDKSKPQASWISSDSSYFSSGSLSHCTPPAGTWGCVGFRPSTLPVVVHITDQYSHNSDRSPYDTRYVKNPHYSKEVYEAYKQKGAKIMTIYQGGNTSQHSQLLDMSTQTSTSVPVCAFKNDQNAWKCGNRKCCTTTNPDGIAPNSAGQCVLSYGISDDSSTMNETIVDGLDALVKYGTYDVSTKIRGDKLPNGKNTSCFIDKIVATQYVAPPQEPEKSCNPLATPAKIKSGSYNDGFRNFATGTSSATRAGAQLKFRVYASNNNCYKPGTETQVFTAHIDVYNPTTGLLFDTQDVAIVVPGIPEQANN